MCIIVSLTHSVVVQFFVNQNFIQNIIGGAFSLKRAEGFKVTYVACFFLDTMYFHNGI